MEIRQLKSFLAVVDEGGFTRAADRLVLSQPTVSAHIHALERELGEPLFARAGRGGVRLTSVGAAAVAPARETLDAAHRVRESVADLTSLLHGRLALGHISSGAATTLLEPLLAFHESHPQVEVSLVEDDSDRLLERLLAGSLDLVWVGDAGDLPRGVGHRAVLDERVVLAVGPDHPFARRRSVTLATAVSQPLVALPRGTGARTAFDVACRSARLTPDIAFECSSPPLLGALAARGVGVAIVAEPLARALDLVVVPVTTPTMRSRMSLCWNRADALSPAAREFLRVVGGTRSPPLHERGGR